MISVTYLDLVLVSALKNALVTIIGKEKTDIVVYKLPTYYHMCAIPIF